jgi:threonine aldolase
MIDLFSDTHTLPDDGMRRAMADAEVGDEQLGEDPTTRALEERVAELLGTEAAVFFPTGAMCNKAAVAAATRPGDAVVCDHQAHVYRFEGGGPAAISGVMFEPLITEKGMFTVAQLESVLNQGNNYQPRTALVTLEQTHNFAGGTVWPLDQYEAVAAAAHEFGALVYTDGARLLNAVAATGVPADRWTAPVDAMWIDFSKGLGAPGGAALGGSTEFVAAADRIRYMLGGAMRQSGILAAGALYGLEHNSERLADDHANAGRLAEGLADLGLEVQEPESNMVFCLPPSGTSIPQFIDALAAEGVRVHMVAGRVRMVLHLGVSGDDVDAVIAAAAKAISG